MIRPATISSTSNMAELRKMVKPYQMTVRRFAIIIGECSCAATRIDLRSFDDSILNYLAMPQKQNLLACLISIGSTSDENPDQITVYAYI